MTLTEAKDILRIEETNTANDALIQSLIDAIPNYIEVSTGMIKSHQDVEPMAKTVAGFILTLWYFGDHADDVKLRRVIDNLLLCLKMKAGY